jgi:hypothetical protein
MISVDPTTDKEIDLASKVPEAQEWLVENIYPFIRPFSCAEPLKEFCVNILGLSPENVYGTQEDKSQLTNLMWENTPTYKKNKDKTGQMTYREVLQYFGSDIIRKWHDGAWAQSLINNIKKWSPLIATVDDIRFINEINAIHSLGGKVIRLTRKVNEDDHVSEKELDSYEGFDKVIDNANHTSLKQTLDELIDVLIEWEWLPPLNNQEVTNES